MTTFSRAIIAAAASATIAIAGAQAAGDKGTADEAAAMVKKAHAHFDAVGQDQALKDFASGEAWMDRDLYMFCLDATGTNRAHRANPKLIGKNLSKLKDADGNLFIADMIKVGQSGGGWVDYTWPNPLTKKVEAKSSLVEPFGDVFCGVGIYK